METKTLVFPSSEASSYLPAGINNSISESWPKAKTQFEDFLILFEKAQSKLNCLTSFLPGELSTAWYFKWADSFLFHTSHLSQNIEDIKSLYEFARHVDKNLHLSSPRVVSKECLYVEFNFYSIPMQFENDGKTKSEYLGNRNPIQLESNGLKPITFPGFEYPSGSKQTSLINEEFLLWASFLLNSKPFTCEQLNWLQCTTYSTNGNDRWIKNQSLGQLEGLRERIVERLQSGIRHVSDGSGVASITVNAKEVFASSLDSVSQWIIQIPGRLKPAFQKANTIHKRVAGRPPTIFNQKIGPAIDEKLPRGTDILTRYKYALKELGFECSLTEFKRKWNSFLGSQHSKKVPPTTIKN